MSQIITQKPSKVILRLNSPDGDSIREVLDTPPRPCIFGEIPCIDLTGLGATDTGAIQRIAREIKTAAVTSGVFYIKNHGISREIIEEARLKSLEFFRQPMDEKWKVERSNFNHHNGWTAPGNARANASEGPDVKEQFRWHYSVNDDPMYDHLPKPIALGALPAEIQPYIWADERLWSKTAALPNFNDAVKRYWRATINLARDLTKAIAVALEMPADGMDDLITYPSGDMALNFYPGIEHPTKTNMETSGLYQGGLGSHTDLQCFTILFQDHIGGLQVLNKDGQWIEAPPIADTLIVNIGDFLSRLTNDKWESTVHRVEVNRTNADRISMPLFFGFNFNKQCAVLPTCTDENSPPKYAPLSCGEAVEPRN
ncbi:2OG-Fe(II) oxygenase superfamily protein [Mollisia scopiformis]|uniref:2OG-Fe(II) oxygenase superfamily protein n=1 Tax=Mollisia scopiformis TaxID=149040 RepID=A0A194XBW1_MOLSC|nr:2OG-Fe(II) oxygenase superfamily protein [Mollisia scopiformis]KUJ17242.1 2OG-Fe(II) oxygenase superfamily protein [Mollisia scopiformis]